MHLDGVLIPIIAVASVPIIAIGLPLAKAYARRMEARPNTRALAPDAAARLERIEQAIDAIAVEVERISEGQRFTTRLLSDRVAAEPAKLPFP
jgi:hypothetical protein